MARRELEHQADDLTGGRALDYYEVASIFSEVLDREIRYTDPSLLRFLRESVARGTPLMFALIMAGLYTSTRFGMADRVTDTVERLLGRPPIPFRRYVRDYAGAWR